MKNLFLGILLIIILGLGGLVYMNNGVISRMPTSAGTASVTLSTAPVVSLFCQTDRMLFSVTSYNGKIYAGSYSTIASNDTQNNNANLYDCTAGGSGSIVHSFNAESVYSLSEYNGALYMSLEKGGGNHRAQMYKYSNGNFTNIYSDPSWSYMFGLKSFNGYLYAGLGNESGGAGILKCTENSCSKLPLANKSINGGYTQFGIHNNGLYVPFQDWSGAVGSSKLLKIGSDDSVVLQFDNGSGGSSGPVSFKGSMYYNIDSWENNYVKIYRAGTEVARIQNYPQATWIGVSGDYIYSAVSQKVDVSAGPGSSVLYRSQTGDSGTWGIVANIPMPIIFSGYVDSAGTIYLAGGDMRGNKGRIYKVTLPAPANICTSFTYSSWGACQSNNTQSRTITSQSPSGCTDGIPVISQSCTYTYVPQNNAQFISQSVPANMTAGQSYQVSVTMKNTGATTWSKATSHKLGSQNPQNNKTWGLNRVDLTDGESIASDQQKTFTFNITAPATSGTYSFQWRMVQEYVAWFGELTPTVNIPADTTPPPVPQDMQVSAVSSSQINLFWNLSTDTVGVAGYRVYRNGTQIATTATNNYFDAGLSPSTSYSYTVTSYDASGNISGQSASVSASTFAPPAVPPKTISFTNFFTKFLYLGMQDAQVRGLQEFLGKNTSIYPEGLVTGYFGSLTQKAVRRFQCKYYLVCSGTPQSTGYGQVGPLTRAKLNALYNNQ